jgi:hypothetical protein
LFDADTGVPAFVGITLLSADPRGEAAGRILLDLVRFRHHFCLVGDRPPLLGELLLSLQFSIKGGIPNLVKRSSMVTPP